MGSDCTVPRAGASCPASIEMNISLSVVYPPRVCTFCWSACTTEYVAWWKKHVRSSSACGSVDQGCAAVYGVPRRVIVVGAICGCVGCAMASLP